MAKVQNALLHLANFFLLYLTIQTQLFQLLLRLSSVIKFEEKKYNPHQKGS
jgi:hypothetical protein